MASKVFIIGAGAMGLAAAYHAAKAGHAVTVFEVDKVPGGMAAHFDFDGMSIERFYHFVCKTDYPTFDLMKELGIEDQMRWVDTAMGYYVESQHYAWGNPFALLKFPLLNLWEKFRYGLFALKQTKKHSFDDIEHLNAKDWIIRDTGEKVYNLLWKRLLELKFYEFTDNISASWIATRIKRVGLSRKSMFQEQLGYIEGGSQTLVDALVHAIQDMGCEIRLGTAIEQILTEDGKVRGVRHKGGEDYCDHIISTVPTPLISKLVPSLTETEKSQYDSINNIGVVCLLFKLNKSVSENFWLNIIDESIDIPGIIEFSNLRALDHSVVYVPYYMPTTNQKFSQPDQYFVDEAFSYLQKINPDIAKQNILSTRVGRLKYAQPICEPGFKDKIPNIQTSIEGLQIADTCYYYPEDRGISESVRIAREMVKELEAV